jgi:U3 small nucleolar RNA-associated protein 14
MKGQRLRQGMHLRYGGREYIIEKRLPAGELQLKDIITEEHRAVDESTLRSELFTDDVVLLGEAREYEYLQEKQKHTRVTDLTALDDDDEIKRQTDRRLAYVREAVATGITKFTEETLRPIIERVSRVIGDANPPSRWSVYRWLKDFCPRG